MVENLQNPLLGKIAAYTEILAADPHSTIFVSLSESYRKLGMLDEAYSVAMKGLTHLPDYGPGHVVLARIKCQQGDLEASEASFKKALEFEPDSLAALVGYSRLCLLQENKAEARKLLLTARELSPADSVINKLLLGLPEPVTQPEAVVSEVIDPVRPAPLAQDVKAVPSVEPLETATLADLYLKQGMLDKALNIYRNLIIREPDNLEFRRRIRDIELLSDGSPEGSECNFKSAEDLVASDTDAQETEKPSQKVAEAGTMTPPGSPAGEMSALAQLNCLLTSIQKRRGDV